MFDECLEYAGKGLATVATFGGCCWAGNKLINGSKGSKEEQEVTTYETTRDNHRAAHRVLIRKDGVLVDDWGLCVDPMGRVLDPSEAVYTAEDLWEWRAKGWLPNNSGYQQQRYAVEIGNHRFGVSVPRRQQRPQRCCEDEYYYEDEYEYERPRPRKRRPQDARRRIRLAEGPDGPVRVYDYDED